MKLIKVMMIGAMLLLNMNGVNAIEIKSNEKKIICPILLILIKSMLD